MDRSNKKILKYYINASQQIPAPYGSMLHIPPTNCLLLTAKQEPYKEAYLLTKNIEEFSGKSLDERASRQKKIRQKGNRTRQKNKRGDSKVESNDSSEIPDRGATTNVALEQFMAVLLAFSSLALEDTNFAL